MAGDWIKMRGNLWDDPRVSALVDATDSNEAAIVGALYWLWATADQHSEDGFMSGLTARQIDRKTGVQGFASALEGIGWIASEQGGVRIARFDEHNGVSAKKRVLTAKRVAKHAASKTELTQEDETTNAQSVSPALGERYLEKEKEKDIDQKQDQKQKRSPTGSRLPPDWVLPLDWEQWAQSERPDLDIRREAASFADYWHGVAGAKGRKADWAATWRNWIRNARGSPSRASPPQTQSKTLTALETLQGLKHGNLDSSRDFGRPEQAALPEPRTYTGG